VRCNKDVGRVKRSEPRQSIAIILCILCLIPTSGMSQKCIFYPVPGEVTLSIDNNTSEEETIRALGGYKAQGLKLDKIISETILISLDDRAGMDTRWIENNPYVTLVRKTHDHVSVLFDGRVTDKYALEFIHSNTNAQIQYITRRHPRKARIKVPSGQELLWSEKFSHLDFVKDASPVCASRYRATCEHYRGIIELSSVGEENCRLPEPPVDWNVVLADKRAECRRSGGTWKMSRDSCVDDCSFAQDMFCWNRVTDYCDCGELKCWYENTLKRPAPSGRGTCIDNPDWLRQFKK